MMEKIDKKVVFVGAGNMARAMIQGILAEELIDPKDIVCYSPSGNSSKRLQEQLGVIGTSDIDDLSEGDLFVIACKPFQLLDLPAELISLTEGKIVLSVLAGTSIEKIRTVFSYASCIIRTMPNTPSQIQEGFTAYTLEKKLMDQDKFMIQDLLSSFGVSMEIAEDKMDAITAISGSGPAYIFEFAAGLISAAKDLGLTEDEAAFAVKRTLRGAALLLEPDEVSAEVLRDNVTSKGGTTEAALNQFKEGQLRALISNAVNAARDRSVELSSK
jgi:pyrroline-5-carboxylate reductase